MGNGSVSSRFRTLNKRLFNLKNGFAYSLVGDFCLTLGISDVHVMAPMGWAVNAALRFSLLFPVMCRSIALCGTSIGAE